MKTIGGMLPFFAHRLMALCMCTNFKKISQRVSELLSGHILNFTREHNHIKYIDGVIVLVLCTLSNNALFLAKFCESISKGC